MLAALKGGCHTSFGKLYEKYWARLYVSAYNLLRNQSTAEDIIQEIFVTLWMKRAEIRVDNLNAYLYTAVRFQVLKAIRDGKCNTDLADQLNKLSTPSTAESTLNMAEINQRLEESIAMLPLRCREIFILSRKEHLTTVQISKRLNLSLKTIENQMTIALRRIKANMGDLLFWLAVVLPEVWLK